MLACARIFKTLNAMRSAGEPPALQIEGRAMLHAPPLQRDKGYVGATHESPLPIIAFVLHSSHCQGTSARRASVSKSIQRSSASANW